MQQSDGTDHPKLRVRRWQQVSDGA